MIDDVLPVQNMLRKMLQESGVEKVFVASSGSEGMNYLMLGGIDLLLDIHLPDMSGLEVLRKIRQENNRLHVVVVTGYEEMETVQEIVRLGANRYLVKPVKLVEIKQVVEQLERRP